MGHCLENLSLTVNVNTKPTLTNSSNPSENKNKPKPNLTLDAELLELLTTIFTKKNVEVGVKKISMFLKTHII